ncbi:hypothetical protein KAU08_00020, partial [bacterium]|nr:hypothetical protein [bacterium]
MKYGNFIPAIIIVMVLLISCSSGGSNPMAPNEIGEQPGLTHVNSSTPGTNTFLMGYYDIYFDIEAGTFEAVEDRTASYTVNVVPFLNLMVAPPNGITFSSIVLHEDDPTFLGVDVEFHI